MKQWPMLAAVGIVSALLGFVGGRSTLHPAARHPSAPATISLPSLIAVAPAPPAASTAKVAQAAPSGVPALNLLRTVIDTHAAQAQACLVFSAVLATGQDLHAADFIRIDPAIKPAMQITGNRICIAACRSAQRIN